MKKQNIIKDFSQLVWQEMNSSVQVDIEYSILKNSGNILVLFAEEFVIVQKLLSHIGSYKEKESTNVYKKNALIIMPDGRPKGESLHIVNGRECFDVCRKFDIQKVVVIKPHIHSLDGLYLEAFLCDRENSTENFVFAYEADELSRLVNVERHIESLQLYWHMMNWFAKSDLKEKYIQENGS